MKIYFKRTKYNQPTGRSKAGKYSGEVLRKIRAERGVGRPLKNVAQIYR